MPRKPKTTLIPALFATWLAGCSVGPEFHAPDDVIGNADLRPRENNEAHAELSDAGVPIEWWTLFGDPLLTELQSEVASANLDLMAALSRVQESQSLLGITNSSLQPKIGLGASYEQSALSENTPLVRLGAPTTSDEQWVVGFQAAWEIDLWGHLHSLSESANAELQASRYAAEAVRVSIGAEVAATYLRLRGTQAQSVIAKEQLSITKRLVFLAESRERDGIGNRFEVATARAEVAQQEARLRQLQHQSDVLMNALALLLGQPPRRLDQRLSETQALPTMPTDVPVGVPSQLARRRPDILQAEAHLHAATADIGAAKADFYPRLNLAGNFGMAAYNLGDLSSWNSRQFAFGSTLYLPIFDGGRLKQTLALTEARHRSAGIAYRQTVLKAWHEIDNSLDAYASERERNQQLRFAADQSQQALTVAERNFQEGATGFLEILSAERSVNASQSALTESSTLSALSVVALYKSLGGGWSPQEVTAANAAPAGSR